MKIERYEPWSWIRETQNALDRMFRDLETQTADHSNVVTSEWMPAVDIREEADRFVLDADLPGVAPNDIEVTMEKGILFIRGERKLAQPSQEEGYRRSERARGAFYRRFALPDSADPQGIEAQDRNGVLTITIPKKEPAKARRIEILH